MTAPTYVCQVAGGKGFMDPPSARQPFILTYPDRTPHDFNSAA